MCTTEIVKVGVYLVHKQAQLKGWLSVGCYLTYYPWVLEYHIPLQADNALDSLDDHLKIEGES